MITRSLLSVLTFAVLAGCVGQPPSTETPTDHPGHPMAAEAPAPERSRSLRDQQTAPSDSRNATKSAAPVVYTCPHHPEVTSNEPGVCPKCEMKLQPKRAGSGSDAPAGGAAHDSNSQQGHNGHGGH